MRLAESSNLAHDFLFLFLGFFFYLVTYICLLCLLLFSGTRMQPCLYPVCLTSNVTKRLLILFGYKMYLPLLIALFFFVIMFRVLEGEIDFFFSFTGFRICVKVLAGSTRCHETPLVSCGKPFEGLSLVCLNTK